jgi:hypothetical protein
MLSRIQERCVSNVQDKINVFVWTKAYVPFACHLTTKSREVPSPVFHPQPSLSPQRHSQPSLYSQPSLSPQRPVDTHTHTKSENTMRFMGRVCTGWVFELMQNASLHTILPDLVCVNSILSLISALSTLSVTEHSDRDPQLKFREEGILITDFSFHHRWEKLSTFHHL